MFDYAANLRAIAEHQKEWDQVVIRSDRDYQAVLRKIADLLPAGPGTWAALERTDLRRKAEAWERRRQAA